MLPSWRARPLSIAEGGDDGELVISRRRLEGRFNDDRIVGGIPDSNYQNGGMWVPVEAVIG